MENEAQRIARLYTRPQIVAALGKAMATNHRPDVIAALREAARLRRAIDYRGHDGVR